MHIFFVVTYEHDSRSKVFPAKKPEQSWLVSSHLFYTVAKSVGSKKPTDGNCLEEANPQQRHSAGWIEVHKLEEIDTTLEE